MATKESETIISYVAQAAIAQFAMVVPVAATDRGVTTAGVGANPLGVCQNKPAALGHAASIAVDGVTRVRAGAVVATGAPVGSDSTGRAITVAAGPLAIGFAITPATAADQIIEVQLH